MSAADATRVQEARRRLESFPPDAEMARMPAAELVTWAVRMQGAAQLLDAYVRDSETDDTRCLGEIRELLSRFDWERDDRQYALEAIERIVNSTQEGELGMEVDTGTFRAIQARADGLDALAADVADIRNQVRRLHFDRLLAYAEGAADQAERAVLRAEREQAALGRGRHARPRGQRPGHLRVIGGGMP